MRRIAVILALVALPALGRGEEPKEFKLSADVQKILDLTNAERAKEDLPPLKPNPRLTAAARAHSANMARQEKMAHELDGKKPADRAEDAGYEWSRIGENVAYGQNVSIERIMKGWMESEGHRKNIL